jgi:hypothetical protein
MNRNTSYQRCENNDDYLLFRQQLVLRMRASIIACLTHYFFFY